MSNDTQNLASELLRNGISRRSFLKFCTSMASVMALSPAAAAAMADKLATIKRQSVIWLSFQECTGCTESLTRSHKPSLENLIFNFISLDYHHTLQAASGSAAEEAREQAMHDNKGKYILVVDGAIPIKDGGVYSTIAGMTNLDMLQQVAKDAAAIVAVGTCATFGGLPKASPNPTGAVSVSDIIHDKPIINVPGCPPIPV
ncbi:MAG: hydrogenase small subunit, partial [Gammaproteobacteria bacterium]|nr:hydrogenase small subunit [Gammaproteobacteria bacterium]